MPGRILIADDRFASRLMLSALFSGAYYDILQADRATDVLATVRTDRPGAVVISDGLPPRAPVACAKRCGRPPIVRIFYGSW